MSIQTNYTILFIALILIQFFCLLRAFRSEKKIGRYTAFLNLSLIPLILSNIVIINSYNPVSSVIGYYVSYISMTLVLLSLAVFTKEYCRNRFSTNKRNIVYNIMYVVAIADIVQILLGPIFKHVFTLTEGELEKSVYYRDVAGIGLTIHRIVGYGLFGGILLIFLVNIIISSKLYREKYVVIFVSMIVSGLLQLMFIFSKIPIDRSIIVHGIFGAVVFYFSLFHRPLRVLDAMLSNVASYMSDAVFVFDAADKCMWANNRAYEMIGLEPDKEDAVKDKLMEFFGNVSGQGEEWTKDLYLPKNNRFYILEKKTVNTGKKMVGSFLVIRDDTERRREIEREIYDSTHDALTGIYNMQHLFSRMKSILSAASPENKFCAVYINIRNFKIINDIFGKQFGDEVLIILANWIKENCGREGCIYGRLIGDTFGIFMPVEMFDENIFAEGLSGFEVENGKIKHQVYVHIGVYNPVNRELDPYVMFDRAHLALSGVSNEYKTILKYYDDTIRQLLLGEQQLISDLNGALESEDIQPYLQPIVDGNGKIVGAEALARWIHPTLGFLSPASFIPLFEKNGLITDVDRSIWEQSCRILQKWKGVHDDLFISINISPKDFYFIDVLAELKELIIKYDIEPVKLRIEITETAMMNDPEDKIIIFKKLREEGFIIEMDDFGSGYSSLNLLKDMPVDVLKLDMKFLSDKSERSDTIIKNIINLSNELHMTSLTEGVETEEQYEMLSSMGCTLFQGYYFSKPVPVDELNSVLEKM